MSAEQREEDHRSQILNSSVRFPSMRSGDLRSVIVVSGQTPDFPATHAAVATVAPFPAWRGSQGLRCAEPGI